MMFLKIYGLIQLAIFAGVAWVAIFGGRHTANAHPDVRGGGDLGFGGSADVEAGLLTLEIYANQGSL